MAGGTTLRNFSLSSGLGVSDVSESLSKYMDALFVQPMDLSEPREDILGYTQICSVGVDDLESLRKFPKRAMLQLVPHGPSHPILPVRLWSRASGRYVSILPVGGVLYARSQFGPSAQLLLVFLGGNCVMLRDRESSNFISVRQGVVTGRGLGLKDCQFYLCTTESGYVSFECATENGSFLGVRENGNIMLANYVSSESVHSFFILQRETMA